LPRSVFGPRLAIDVRLGRVGRKSNGRLSSLRWDNYLTN